MLIDWFTVGAQAFNFIVLVWLLKRFLYKPILNAIDVREQRIARASADADRQRSELQTSRDAFQAQSKTFDEQRGALLAKAAVDANAEGARLLSIARQAADSLTAARDSALQKDTATLGDELARLATAGSLDIARAALRDLADVDLEGRIVDVFAHRVREMNSTTKESFGLALKRPNGDSVVVSSFDLSDRDKDTIRTAVNETFAADIRLHFEASPQVIAGIALDAAGQRLSWNITDYLKTLEERVAALLKEQTAAAVVPPIPAAPAAAA
jgi:F-type H+-transporting ATPase subunit b